MLLPFGHMYLRGVLPLEAMCRIVCSGRLIYVGEYTDNTLAEVLDKTFLFDGLYHRELDRQTVEQ